MRQATRILDGGMGGELQRRGAPFRQPEWSALALMEAPETVRETHAAFIAAGAEVITTNSYALVPYHLGEERFRRQGRELADLAGRLAREAVHDSGKAVLVAGSLPPPCGSYRPDLFQPEAAAKVWAELVAGLAPHVDVWLAETQSALQEAEGARAAVGDDARPFWISFTLKDRLVEGEAVLRSGERVADAAAKAEALGAEVLLFNCSQPEVMESAVRVAKATRPGLEVGVYANAFPPQDEDAIANEGLSPFRKEVDPPAYLDWARRWVAAGASMVGGCCGIGPEHIARLAEGLRSE
ncbi:homocysteine S-methyltransferase family protein [Aquibaculum sediminis]|uniref:homocysteine S-methyltransferase family protein n=1 Tax=Aquibaculum sediminis TaxID=3231907 RepID=UPI00345123B6